MSTLRTGLVAAVALIGVGCALVSTDVAAQRTASPPDFYANKSGWLSFSNEFIPPESGPRPTTWDPKHPFVQNNTAQQPTFRVADLSNPNLKPWAKERMKKANDAVFAGKVALTARSSCRPGGVPGFMLFVQNPIFFIQTPKQVMMVFTGNQEVRRVYMDQPHSAKPKPTWYGESVGHYEGDTLVVDTIGVDSRTFVDNYRTPHTEKLHVTERWKLIEDGKLLEVNIRVEDPDTFYEPWSASQRYRRVPGDLTEQYCAEGHQHAAEYNIPTASTPDF